MRGALLLASVPLLLTIPAWGQEPVSAPPAPAVEISDSELFEKSLEAARQALEYYGEWEDPAAAKRVADLGYRLAQHSGFSKFPLTFLVVDIPIPNAFALPGGQIFITRGMLEQNLDDEQLAGLIGHEIAHVTQSHGIRLQRRASLLNALSQALVVGAILTSDNDRRPADLPADIYGRDRQDQANRVYGIAATGMFLGELLLRSYSREFEDEADEEGQRLAAAAGFDPAGTVGLMDTLSARMPQNKEFGYWQTHPFFDERIVAARARAELMRASAADRSAQAYRQATQQVLLQALTSPPSNKDRRPEDDPAELNRRTAQPPQRPRITRELYLEKVALAAWPSGPDAERLRQGMLDRLEANENTRPELARNYGELVAAWRAQLETVRELTPASPFVASLESGIARLEASRAAMAPRAIEVFEAGVWETTFLESFLSNWPDAPQAPQVALALGDAQARLRREGDAAESYLQAWRLDREGEYGARAMTGLRRMTPRLENLNALEALAAETGDPEVARLAAERLAALSMSYDSLAMGAQYLREYPHGSQVTQVEARLATLADRLYGEIVLYQSVGEIAKASERISSILEHAPFSPAAERLRSRTVVSTDG